MRIKLLGYLSYVLEKDFIEMKDVKNIEEVLKEMSNMKRIKDLLYDEHGNITEGILIILNGNIVNKNMALNDDDELIITLPTTGG